MSPEEAQRNKADLDNCIGELTTSAKKAGDVPAREARTVEILECMQGKGWDLVYNEIVVTS